MSTTQSSVALRFGSREAAFAGRVDEDAHLLESCRQGDPDAFEALFRKHQAYVYNISLGMLGNPEDAADMTQEAFLRIHRSLGKFGGRSTFSTWLYRVTVNLCITELRRRKRAGLEYLDDYEPAERARLTDDEEVTPGEALEIAEDRRLVQQVLGTLPPDYRAIMTLRHFQQLAYEEIADVLQLSLSQVKTRLFRARRMFKDRFKIFLRDTDAM